MSDIATTSAGRVVFAADYWERLSQDPGAPRPKLTLPCCQVPAEIKTDNLGTPFFSHTRGDCASPESLAWYRLARDAITRGIKSLDVVAKERVPIGRMDAPGVADMYLDIPGNPVAIQIEHHRFSLPHLEARQDRFAAAGIQAFWVLPKSQYIATAHAILKGRLREEYDNRLPVSLSAAGALNQRGDLPMVWLESGERESVMVPGLNPASVERWIRALVEGTFLYGRDGWRIHEGTMAST